MGVGGDGDWQWREGGKGHVDRSESKDKETVDGGSQCLLHPAASVPVSQICPSSVFS